MLKQSLKDVYFALTRIASLPNLLVVRIKFRNLTADGLYLHLGSGDDYINGLINIDGNIMRKKDVWWDLRNRLPFEDRAADFVYCSHTLEHLYPDDALSLLRDICRVLRVDGACRMVVPSFEFALEIARGDGQSTWPRKFSNPADQAINYLFCDGQHRYAYTETLLREFAHAAGFAVVVRETTKMKQYGHVVIGGEEPGSLVMELRRS